MSNKAEHVPRNIFGELEARLRRTQARLVANRAMEKVSLAIGSAAIVWLTLEILAILGIDVIPQRRASIALLFGILMVLGAVHAIRTAPTLVEVARRADRVYALKDRIATALQYRRQVPPGRDDLSRLLVFALIEDAEKRSGPIDPRELAPVAAPRFGLIAAGVLVLAILVHTPGSVRDALQSIKPRDPGAVHSLTATETQDLATRLRETSRLMRAEADATSDEYLEAVARALDNLEARLGMNGMTISEVQRELSGLIEHVDRAFQAGTQEDGLRDDALAEAARDQRFPARNSEDLLGDGDLAEWQAPGSESEVGSREAFRGLDILMSELGDIEASLREAARERERAERGRAAGCEYFEDCGAPAYAPQNQPRQDAPVVEGTAGGEPIGAAQESNRGAGDMAGEGVQPLDVGDPAAKLDTAEWDVADVVLPQAIPNSETEHVERQFTPQTSYTAIEQSVLAAAGNATLPHTVELRETTLGPQARIVASRYFDRDLLLGGESP